MTPQQSNSGKSYSKKKKLTPQKSSSSKSILIIFQALCLTPTRNSDRHMVVYIWILLFFKHCVLEDDLKPRTLSSNKMSCYQKQHKVSSGIRKNKVLYSLIDYHPGTPDRHVVVYTWILLLFKHCVLHLPRIQTDMRMT